MYMPSMECFASVMPMFTDYDPLGACDYDILNWLEAMEQLECCQLASPNAERLLQAVRQVLASQSFSRCSFRNCEI